MYEKQCVKNMKILIKQESFEKKPDCFMLFVPVSFHTARQ